MTIEYFSPLIASINFSIPCVKELLSSSISIFFTPAIEEHEEIILQSLDILFKVCLILSLSTLDSSVPENIPVIEFFNTSLELFKILFADAVLLISSIFFMPIYKFISF